MIDDFDFPETSDRPAFVKAKLATVGVSLDDPTMKLPGRDKPQAPKPAPKVEEVFAGDFLFIEGSWPVSRDLAKQLHYSAGDKDGRPD